MDEKTKEILKEINNETLEMNISEMEIDGILNLKKFKKLTIVDCSQNSIRKLSGFSSSFEELNCSSNQITKLEFGSRSGSVSGSVSGSGTLPSLLILNCSKNKIKHLDNLPENITFLNCDYNSITELKNLPNQLTQLSCLGNKITHLDYLPESLEILNCSQNSIVGLDNLPINLKILVCSYTRIENLSNLPMNLSSLYCDNCLLEKLDNLPEKIKILDCSNNWNLNIEDYTFPNNMIKLVLPTHEFSIPHKINVNGCLIEFVRLYTN